MPAVLALLPALLPAIASGVGLGTSIYSMANKPGAPKPTTAPTVTPAQALQTRGTQEAALSQTLPGLQAQVGGSLSPDALLRLAEIISGQGNAPGIGSAVQDILQKQFNVSAGGSALTSTPGAPGLTPGGSTYG